MRSPIRASLRTLSLILACVALASPGALAKDDAGGRSVFADGVGNRPLAMGGAYAGVADDANAAIWNPGGLGFVPQSQFLATHTNLLGMGFSEQYAAFVMPNWRWGVVSATFVNFGVDGIEGRDPDNWITDPNLKDSEWELGLGYGRALNAAWSLGGNVKLRRHSLAGYNDTGLGLDLGLMVRPALAIGVEKPWAKNLNLGAALRNVVEPSIRLDEESVPDPRAVRLGAAFTQFLGKEMSLLGAVDVEKTADMYTNLHAGIEWQLKSILAMRLGSYAGDFTAGLGVHWKEIGIDYTFEDNPEKSIHRFGLSIWFGPTVSESRMAALAAEEAMIQARLSEAFTEHNRIKINGFLAEANMALEDSRYEEALEILAMVKVLDPDHEQASILEASALRRQAAAFEKEENWASAVVAYGRILSQNPDDVEAVEGLVRVRNKSDLAEARSVNIRQSLDAALDAFAAGKLLKAREGFRSVLASSPEDKEAEAMLRRTEEAIQFRSAELVQQGRTLIKAGQYPDAREALDKARNLNPDTEGLAQATALLTTATTRKPMPPKPAIPPIQEPPSKHATGQDSAAPAGGPATERDLSEKDRQELSELYRRGMASMEAKRADEAVHYWELVWAVDPNYQRVSDFLKEEYLTRGMEAFVAGDLHNAVSDWEKAIRVDPDDSRAKGYLQRAQQRLSRMQQISNQSK